MARAPAVVHHGDGIRQIIARMLDQADEARRNTFHIADRRWQITTPRASRDGARSCRNPCPRSAVRDRHPARAAPPPGRRGGFGPGPGLHHGQHPEAVPQVAHRSTRRRAASCPSSTIASSATTSAANDAAARTSSTRAGERRQDVIDAFRPSPVAQDHVDGIRVSLMHGLPLMTSGLTRSGRDGWPSSASNVLQRSRASSSDISSRLGASSSSMTSPYEHTS